MSVVEHAPAKINLGLHILRKRPDGLHAVETVLHRIDWHDTITVEHAPSMTMTCSDASLPTDEENLCVQAALRLAEELNVDRSAAIHLEKRIPYGAGLGGGSSDAAAVLRGLITLWDVQISAERLHAIARGIGADVPFFVEDARSAHATGVGDELTILRDATESYRIPFSVLVVVPSVRVSTPDAYRRVIPNDHPRPHLPSVVTSNDLGRWRRSLINDFERPIMDAYPEIARVHRWLDDHGAEYVSLSGSGSAVFGVFPDVERAKRAYTEGVERWSAVRFLDGNGSGEKL